MYKYNWYKSFFSKLIVLILYLIRILFLNFTLNHKLKSYPSWCSGWNSGNFQQVVFESFARFPPWIQSEVKLFLVRLHSPQKRSLRLCSRKFCCPGFPSPHHSSTQSSRKAHPEGGRDVWHKGHHVPLQPVEQTLLCGPVSLGAAQRCQCWPLPVNPPLCPSPLH